MKRKLTQRLGVLAIAMFVAMLAAPADALITNADIASNAGITYGKLKLGGKIDSDDIKNGSIQGKDIKSGTITGSKIDDDAIDSDKIDDGSITAADLAAGTLTATTLADGSVTSAKILDSTVASADIAADTIVAADIATGGVGTAEILDGTILTGDISADTILAADIAAGAVATSEILDGTIAAADLATDLAITTSGVGTFTGNVNLGNGNDDVVVSATDWSVDGSGQAYFTQMLVTGNATALDDATLVFEGATADEFETFFYAADPTADRDIIFPNVSGTVVTSGDTGSVTSAMIAANTIVAADLATDLAIVTTGASALNGGITVDTTNFTVDGTTGAVVSASTVTGTGIYASSGAFDTSSAMVMHIGEAFATTLTITPTTTITGDLVVNGGDVSITPKAVAGTAAEGNIYYDSTDDNLYVYANGGWVDLTAGAAGALTMDDTYNASAGASTVLVDNGDLTLRSNAGATGDIIVDLASTGDFILQDNGTDVVTFSDAGNLTMTSGTLALNGDAVTSDGDLTITGATGLNATATTGDLDLTSTAGSIILTAGENAADSIQIISSIGGIDITAAAATAEDIDILNTGGSVNITATEAAADAIVLSASTALGGIDIISNADVDITTTGADGEDISLTNTGGSVNITATEAAADAIVLSASTALGGIDITSNADIDITTTGADGEDISLTNTGGSVNITATEAATDAIVINASTAAGGIDITSNEDIDITTTGAAGEDITVGNTGGSVIVQATESAADAIKLEATAGGVDILASGAAAGEDIDITATGSSVNISSTENVTDAITMTASAGGINIAATGAATEDITLVNTGGSIGITATEADASAIVLNASAGGLNVDSALAMDIDTTAGNIVIDSVDGAIGAIVAEDDNEDDLGAAATRWATIYASTLNFENGLTDAASAGGDAANITVALGNSNANDAVTITANTAISDAQWSVSATGVAAFASVDGPVGSVTPAAGTFTTLIGDTVQADTTVSFSTNGDSVNNTADDTFDFTRDDTGTVTITASDDDANAAMLIVAGGTGDLTLGDADSDTTVAGVLAANGATTIGDGGDNVAINSDVWDVNAAGVASGLTGITSSGTISLTGATIGIGDGEADAITLTGDTTIGAGASNNVVVNSNTWDVNAAGVASGLTGVTSTGTVDFNGATAMIVPRGAGAPAHGTCDDASEVGSLYADTTDDAAVVLYVCGSDGDGAGQDWNTVASTDID